MAFLERLTITSGAHAGRPLVLRPWQREALAAIYATDSTGRRPVRTALLSLGRKAGKSTLTAGLALCHLVGPEAVPRGQIIAAAADRNQGGIIYNEAKAFALADPEMAGRLVFREWNKTIEDTETGSVFSTASSDHRKAHGTSPVTFIADEVAQWRNRELLDALRSGQGAHAEPLGIIISTRSPDPDNPLEELIRYGAQVREGILEDSSFASFVWSAPLDADPWDPATWLLANPDADAVRLADIEVQARQAQRLPSQEAPFRAYVLNQPVTADDRFIGPADWDACAGTAAPEGPCFGGLDLSAGPADLTAFSLYWPASGTLKVWAFLPTASFEPKGKDDAAPYRQWQAAGHVVEMPGRAIDRAWLGQWIARQMDGLELVSIAADRWMLNDLTQQWEREGIRLPLKPIGMGFKDQAPALSGFEAAVLDAKLRHGGNPLLRWAVANIAIATDPAGNRKAEKARSRGRIDPAIAAILAVAEAARQPVAPTYLFTGMMLAD
ncbi:terminase large subunit [Roseomonas sp. BN140053]|uniref:terminase large subunit n=1 Tax=Roseomonas sp. BN140053 TaxID=3391898 RepID=UPI0039EB9336